MKETLNNNIALSYYNYYFTANINKLITNYNFLLLLARNYTFHYMTTNNRIKFMHSMKATVLIIFLISSVLIGSTQSWTPEMMIKYKQINSSVISPDGSKVAYEVSVPVMEGVKSEYLTHIWIAATDLSQNLQFTFGDKSCLQARFSPDNQFLSYTSSGEGKSQLYLVPIDGGESEIITNEKYIIGKYNWSPDGKSIAFLMTDSLTDQEEKDKIEKRDMVIMDQFKNAHLYHISLVKNEMGKYPVRRLTTGNFHVTDINWSPDSKTIAFAHQPNSSSEGWYNSDISAIPADSGEVKILVNKKGQDVLPLYSPDGKWLAFISDGGKATWTNISDVYIMPASGGQARKLVNTFNRQPHLIDWSPDGKSLLIDEFFKTNRVVYNLPTDGSNPKLITPANGLWTVPSVSKNGDMMACIFQDATTPACVMSYDLNNQKTHKLSNINADFVETKHAKTDVISWESKDGKYQIEGLVTYPKNYNQNRKYPLILYIHGGPASVFSQTYTGAGAAFPIQAYAEQGYVTLRPNPRGSGGYGSDFRIANRGDWGFGDYEDIMAGVDYLISENIVHPDSMCVTGLSYGGFMTSWIIGNTNRFKAAVDVAGVTNLLSFTNTTDIPDFIPQYFGFEHWENPEIYLKHSPMLYVKNIKTPTLILHGAADLRVPISQSQELYSSLKRQGVATEMVVYPRTLHLVDEPKFILDYGSRTCNWFHKYLKQ